MKMIMAVMPHPPLAVPEVGNGVLKIPETVKSMDEVSRDIASFRPDTVIFFTPHGTVFNDFFHISPGVKASGDFARFGVAVPTYSAEYDVELVEEIALIAEQQNFPAGTFGERDPSLDHGVLVPMHYLNKFYSDYKIVRVSQSGLSASAHFEMGAMIAEATEKLERRVCIIASGDLSHKLGGSYGYAAEGEIFDRDVMKFLSEADFDSLLSMPQDLREAAAECGYGSFAMLAGYAAGREVSAKQLSYECPFGVGYGVVKFNA
ncbi:MAG: AmmeMemoRadiSam system protein B [Defluviitaleaceae bacterium]|nr:AmmeMemoRadiSam system protein B [Defluviitaleaceae bacterium]